LNESLPARADDARSLVVGFDLDMTLVDSGEGIWITLVALADATGDPAFADRDLYDRLIWHNLDDEFALRFAPAEAKAHADHYRELYPQHGVPATTLLAGAVESIAAVRARGGEAVVVTAKFEANAHRCLEHVGLDVTRVIGSVWADAKAEVLAALGAEIYVGDTVTDVRAGRAAGAAAVGVCTGPHSAGELGAAGADVVLANLTEFPAWLAAR
jgi:phosphoglycolate phosphatase